MEFIRCKIPDVVVCNPDVHGDVRGYFSETYRMDKLEEFLGHKVKFCQDNESKSSYGVLRGLHYQLPPFAQTKLVRVIKGKVLDVAVDIREHSLTFGKHVSIRKTIELDMVGDITIGDYVIFSNYFVCHSIKVCHIVTLRN